MSNAEADETAAPDTEDLTISPRFEPASPVDEAPELARDAAPSPGVALCLSGGGYRAMLFHVGAVWRLNELGWLPKLNRISSVSGGSITSAALAIGWPRLAFSPGGVAAELESEFVQPVRQLAGRTIDAWSIIGGLITPDTISEMVAKAYDEHLLHGKTLQDLPDEQPGVAPRFIFNASNVQSGALFRFSKPFLWDWRVGKIENPRLSLALAVAASSAFPPVLSPLQLTLDEADYTPRSGADLQRPPYTTRPMLTDGGVYDNLGLETAWKRYRTILVSDAGGKMTPVAEPKTDWLRHTKRVLDLVDNQVRSLRKRQVIQAFKLPRDGGPAWRDGTYWGIRTDIADYGLRDPLPCSWEKTIRLATEPTRLAELDDRKQERLINWGYAVCDAAMRRWVVPGATPGPRFPYQSSGIG